MTGETAAYLRFLPFFIFCDGHHRENKKSVMKRRKKNKRQYRVVRESIFRRTNATVRYCRSQLGDLIIRHEPNALFNAQNGHFVHFHSGKLHARGQLTLGQVLTDTQVVQTVPDQVLGITIPIDFHDPSPRF